MYGNIKGYGHPLHGSFVFLTTSKGVRLRVTMVIFGAALLFGCAYSDCLLSCLIWGTAWETITGILEGWWKKKEKKSHRASWPCRGLCPQLATMEGGHKGRKFPYLILKTAGNFPSTSTCEPEPDRKKSLQQPTLPSSLKSSTWNRQEVLGRWPLFLGFVLGFRWQRLTCNHSRQLVSSA